MAFGPIVKDEIWYKLRQAKGQAFVIDDNSAQNDSVFARFLTSTPINLSPVNKDFAMIIEKIGVNAPVIADVPITNEQAYFEALKSGIAHAASSDYPSETPGNVYMFAHASINFWQAGSYATVFNLLRKLEVKDRINVFFKGDDYIYEVVNKEYLKGWNTYPITRPVIEPTLTLQTCDPPGTTLNRLVVTSHLVKVIYSDANRAQP
jgi:LPXTG-site transpeptidase (sortase) family protein